MGLLDKLKKGKENRETEEKQHYEQQFQQDALAAARGTS